jgi:hypothetical protein
LRKARATPITNTTMPRAKMCPPMVATLCQPAKASG